MRSRLSWIAVLSIPLLVGRVDAERIPDDPRFDEQWALATVRAPGAWAWTTGSARTVVAILDTGIVPHPELQERLLPGYDFVSDRSAAADGDGRDPDPTDEGPWKHGTHVAGIVGASTNNGVGIAGIDWACRILPVRVVGAKGVGKAADVADAIRWAAGLHVDGVPDNETPADVINLSLTTPGHSDAEQRAIHEVVAAGAAVVAAAGNDQADAGEFSPGGLDEVITVGAVDELGLATDYSNYGPRLTLMAPGGTFAAGVLSTQHLATSGYTYLPISGTSQAAPFVSGTIALMKAMVPSLTADQARQLLVLSARPRAGLLDAERALAATHDFQAGTLRLEGPPARPLGCDATLASSAGIEGAWPLTGVGVGLLRRRRTSAGRDRRCHRSRR